jgi:hypothetical protein
MSLVESYGSTRLFFGDTVEDTGKWTDEERDEKETGHLGNGDNNQYGRTRETRMNYLGNGDNNQ